MKNKQRIWLLVAAGVGEMIADYALGWQYAAAIAVGTVGMDVAERLSGPRITIGGQKWKGEANRVGFEDPLSRSEKFALTPEAFALDKALSDAREAFLAKQPVEVVERMVDSFHLIDVTGPDPDRWEFVHLGRCAYSSRVKEPVLSGIPFDSFRRQAEQSYYEATLRGAPCYDFVRRWTDNELAYRRLILPWLDSRGIVTKLAVFVAVEPQPRFRFSVGQMKVSWRTADGQPLRNQADWATTGIALGKPLEVLVRE